MRLQVLGTAAGGGVPQWNCNCAGCAAARTYPDLQRLHASVAIQVGVHDWIVVNATPDIGAQIEACAELQPRSGRRQTPVSGVIFTDAELDHTLGLLRLREATSLQVLAAPAVLAALGQELRLDHVLGSYAGTTWRALGESPTRFGDVEVSSIAVSDKRPRYAANVQSSGPWVSALRITDRATLKTAVYAPCVSVWTAVLESAANEADCVFLDGTFWDDEEPIRAGISAKSATEMGHLPISETATRLSKSSATLRFYTHLNNSNPLIDPAASQHHTLAELGIAVAAEKAVIDL